jgi:hypothetical protein
MDMFNISRQANAVKEEGSTSSRMKRNCLAPRWTTSQREEWRARQGFAFELS